MTRSAADIRAVLQERLRPADPAANVDVLGAGVDLGAGLERCRGYLEAMAPGGWGTPDWPVEHGGAGLDDDELDRFYEEIAAFDVPDLYPVLIGLGMAGPMIIRAGTPAQQGRWLEPTRTGDEVWCQLFSEPEAGSDLAGLRTRATEADGGWRLSGQKTWVSRAAFADWGLLLARTGPLEARHRAITAFVLPMAQPGVELAPIRQANRDSHFSEVYLNDVELSDEYRLGEVDGGWAIAMATLAAERSVAARSGSAGVPPDAVIGLVRESGAAADPLVRQAAARVSTELQLLRLASDAPGQKIRLARAMRQFADLAELVRGAHSMLDDDWATVRLTTPSLSIRGGTDEIQRNVIGERVLGLPREPAPPRR